MTTRLACLLALLLAGCAADPAGLPARLPPGVQPLDEGYRALFETCDRTDRFGGIQLPIRGTPGWDGCRGDPNRVTQLLRWPDGTIAWVSKLAVDVNGSHFACTTPRATDACPTWLMLRDTAGRQVPVDSDAVPYVVIPMDAPGADPGRPGVAVAREFGALTGIGRGDLGVVIHRGMVVPVLVGNGGPWNKLGEGSLALHRRLGRELCAARDAIGRCVRIARPLTGIPSGVITIVFPGSRPRDLRPETLVATVEREAMARWRAFAGVP
jgi:hypothetical protein